MKGAHKTSMVSRYLIASAASLVICAGAYAYMYGQVSDLTESTIDSRNTMRDSAAARLQGSDITGLLSSTIEKRSKLKALFVPSDQAVSLIQTIESVGRDSGALVSISSIRSSEPDEKTRLGNISSSVSVRGTWRQVMRAIALIESLPYDRKIDQISLRSLGGQDGLWQAEVGLFVGTIDLASRDIKK